MSARRVVADFVAYEIADPLCAIAQEAQHSGIDEIGVENAVPGGHLRAYRIGRVPRVVPDGKSIAGIGRELHLRALWQAAVGELLVEDRADMGGRGVAGQIEL